MYFNSSHHYFLRTILIVTVWFRSWFSVESSGYGDAPELVATNISAASLLLERIKLKEITGGQACDFAIGEPRLIRVKIAKSQIDSNRRSHNNSRSRLLYTIKPDPV